MEKVGAIINFEYCTMSLSDIGKAPRACNVSHARHTALSVHWGQGMVQPPAQPTRDTAYRRTAGLRPEEINQQSSTRFVRAKENIFVGPRFRQIFVRRLESEKEQSLPPLVCVEPAQIPIQGILPVRALSQVKSNAQEPSLAKSQPSYNETGPPNGRAYIIQGKSTTSRVKSKIVD